MTIRDVCGNSLRGSNITGTETFDLAGISIAMVRGLGRMPSTVSAARRKCDTDAAPGFDAIDSCRSDKVKTSTSPSSSLEPITRSATMSGGMSEGMLSSKDWAFGYTDNGTSWTTAGTSAGFSRVNSDNCNKSVKPHNHFMAVNFNQHQLKIYSITDFSIGPQLHRESVPCCWPRHREVMMANGGPCTRHNECPAVR